jgi:hypothetical protein
MLVWGRGMFPSIYCHFWLSKMTQFPPRRAFVTRRRVLVARLLETRYGVEIKSVAGCVVTDQLVNYIEGYNTVSRSRIEARLGKDVFAECAQEARTTWQREHPNK